MLVNMLIFDKKSLFSFQNIYFCHNFEGSTRKTFIKINKKQSGLI